MRLLWRTQHTKQHPGERLVIGPCAGFEEALELVVEEHAYEHEWLMRSEPSTADRVRSEQALAAVRAVTRHAGRVYREEQEAARLRTARRLRADALAAEAALDDEAAQWLGLLAEALEAGDYSGLAI